MEHTENIQQLRELDQDGTSILVCIVEKCCMEAGLG
jgi:hypothetical protein